MAQIEDIESDIKSGDFDINDLWVKARVRARNIGQGETPENVVEMLCSDIAKMKQDSTQLTEMYLRFEEGRVLPFSHEEYDPELVKHNLSKKDPVKAELYDEIMRLKGEGYHLGHIANIMNLSVEEVQKLLKEH